MLPKGTEIRVEKDVIYWENYSGFLTVNEAQSISNEIKALVEANTVKAIVVDNRSLTGAWSPEVDRVWIDLMAYLPSHQLKTATVCQSVINKLQFNYLSTQAGTTDTVKAFVEEERDAMKAFLDLSDIRLK